MPRTSRITSKTSVYHIMLRSINRQQIFYDEEDYRHFQELLLRYKTICGYSLYAYCIMGNHVHLLIKTGKEPLDTIFRRIGGAFVYWYNMKYERTGHLFQDRYKSEPVNDEKYFWTVLRYILRNPVAAGICSSPARYPYSSAAEYMISEKTITDTEYVLSLREQSALSDYLLHENNDHCMDTEEAACSRCTDKAASLLILQEFGTLSPPAGKPGDRHALSSSISHLLKSGVSIRQLSRLTGISKKIIESSLKNPAPTSTSKKLQNN